VETTCTSLLDDPTVAGLVLNTRDVSDRTRLEAELTRRAYNDPLTGLANRARFHHLTDEALRRPQRRSAHVAVIYLDLDNFKTINDSLGHLQGDQLLIEFAARLLNATRGCDTVSRLGGDEFAVLLEGMSREEDAIPVAERITAAMQKPFHLGGAEIVIGASIGIAHARAGATAGDAQGCRRHDAAKRDGNGGHDLQPRCSMPSQFSGTGVDLRAALSRVNSSSCISRSWIWQWSDRGAEALLLDHPVRGRLSPQAFIHRPSNRD
jgi:diguanylate cyclase (GGDEF)-like protein